MMARILRLVWLSSAAFLGGAAATHFAAASSDAASPYDVLRQLARVLVLVENEYVEPVERGEMLDGAIEGMVGALDPHSSYLRSKAFRNFRADTQGEFGGVGLEVDFGDDEITVIAPIEGSPADEAGIRPGDKIVAIDKQRVRGVSGAKLVERMRGVPGTTVQVTIRRRGRDKLLNFDLERRIIEVASVAGKALIDNIIYVRVKQFQRGTHDELLTVLGNLRAEKKSPISGVILDLRNNPGGLVNEATLVANEFLDQGVIYTTRHRGETVDVVQASSGGALHVEACVVLVNEFSASASELVAGALQDHGRAPIVGAVTFGKGSVQSIFDLPDGSGLRLTTMRYYTPKGRTIQARGITPDVFVEAAYVRDTSFGVVREEDLDNHLPAEGASKNNDAPQIKPDSVQEEETGVSPTHLGVARVVPLDPTGGPDFALSIGFQLVRGVLRASGND